MKQIPLTQGKFAIVDDEDFEYLNQWKWYCTSEGYAARKPSTGVVYMHRLLTNVEQGKEVDHTNLNRLDNQKSNLRVVDKLQNMLNTPVRSHSRVGLKGVGKRNDCKRSKPYYAKITVNKKKIFLGYFKTAEEAHKVYSEAAKKYFGEFAHTGEN